MEYIKVKDLFKITKGKKVDPLEEKTDNSIRYIQIEDLRNDDNIKFCEQNDKYIIANENDIIIAWDGANAGTIGFGLNGAIGSTLAILRTNNSNINIEFCALFLKSKFRYLRDTCTGATIPHIRRDVLENIEIPSFSIDKQKKIVEILNIANELTNKRKSQIEELDLLVKSRFVEMFGDPVYNPKKFKKVKIKELIDTKIQKSKKVFESNDVISYIDISCIDNVSNTIISNNKYNFDEAPSRAQQCINVGDILISNVRPNLKNIAMVEYQLENMVTTSGITILRSKNINNYFLFQYVLTDYFKDEMVSVTSGANYPAIKTSDIYNHQIINPPIELQNEFAEFVKQVDKLKFEMEQSLKELEDNFNSLMQKAFKGELFE